MVSWRERKKYQVIFLSLLNGLRSGVASGACVIGLATTNPIHEIKKYTDKVIRNYIGFTLPNN